MDKVKFKFGTIKEYTSLETKLDNTLYFLVDSGELYKGQTPIAQSHVYKGIKLNQETDIEALERFINNKIPTEGDIGIVVDNANKIVIFIRDKNDWVQVFNENNYYTKDEIDNLIGTPGFSYTDETGDLVAVPPTGIYDQLLNNASNILPIFDGATAGLVPVYDGVNKANRFLNGLGQWVTINHAGEYVAPDETVHITLEDYVEYMINNYANLVWESID